MSAIVGKSLLGFSHLMESLRQPVEVGPHGLSVRVRELELSGGGADVLPPPPVETNAYFYDYSWCSLEGLVSASPGTVRSGPYGWKQ